MTEQLLSASQAAEYLRVSAPTIRRWCVEGRIPGHRNGRCWRISRSELDRLTVFAWTVLSHEPSAAIRRTGPTARTRG